MELDTFESSHSLSMDLLDTDVFFSTEQLGVSELDMAGLTDVDLATLDTKLADHTIDSNWSDSVDIDLKPSDLVQFGGEEGDQSLVAESDTSNSGPGCLDDDFQKMLTDWENHIGTLSTSTTEQDNSLEQCPEIAADMSSEASSPVVSMSAASSSVRMATARQLPVSLRTHVVPKPGVTYTRVGGSFPRVVTSRISHSPPTSPPPLQLRTKVSMVSSKGWQGSNCPTASLPDNVKFSNCTVSDLSRTLENQKRRMQWLETNFNRNNSVNQARGRTHGNNSSVKIIAAVSPGKNGQSTTRILSTRHDSLPRELIEKIKAASQGRKTIAIIEPINKEKPLPSNFQPHPEVVRAKATSSTWVTASGQSKWRHVGIVNPIQSQNMSDHDYCSPSKTPVKYTKVVRSHCSPVTVKSEAGSRGRDSGLESDASDNSEDGGLYDRLPPYLTSVSVQTGQDPDNDVHYSRVPLYMTTVPQAGHTRQSLLKYNSHQVAVKQEEDIFITKTGGDTFIEDTRESSSERELEENDMIGVNVRQRKRSRSTSKETNLRSRSNSVGIKYRRINGNQRTKIWRTTNDLERKEERRNVVEQRKIVYVGKIEEGTLKADLRQRFEKFGPIVDVSVHFRERGDNYAFITFAKKEDAYQAVEHGNDDPSQPIYDLCFGGRRDFCKEKYFDMDLVDDKKNVEDLDFDSLLEAARVSNS